MPNIKDGVIQIGFETDVKEFIKEIKKELSSVKDWGLSDSLKDEIDDISKMLDGLSKSFSDGMNTKLDTKTFAGFEKKITAEMQTIDKRVTNLEDSMQALVTTMDSADSGKLTSFLQTVGSQMTDLKQVTDATVGAVGELVNLSANSGGAIKLADNSSIEALEKEKKSLQDILDLIEQIDKDENVGDTDLSKNYKKASSTIKNFYSNLISIQEEYNNALAKGADDQEITHLQERYTKAYSELEGLRNQFSTLFPEKENEEYVKNISKSLFDARDVIDEFANRATNRFADVSKALNSLGQKSAISMNKEKSSLTVPMDISTTGKGLANKALRIIEAAQKAIKNNPLQVDFALQSKYSSRKTNDLLKEWQASIGEIDSPELREKFENLYNVIAKDFQKEIKIKVSSNVYDEEVKVKRVIENIKKLVGNKIHIFPEFDIKDVDVAKLQKKVDKIAKQLKLNVDILPKGAEEKTNEQLEALKTLSDTLATKLDNLNKNYLSDIKKSLADILSLAQTLKDSAVQTDAPIDELVSSVKELTVSLQKAFGIFTNDDLDSIFVKMQNSVAGISGSLRGGDKNNLVVQLKEILALYKQYKDLGGTKELTDLGGQANVQKWLVNHANDEVTPTDPFVVEGKNNANGYAEGIRSGIPTVRAAAKEMAEAALEEIRKTQNSNSPAKETEELGQDADLGYGKGLQENLDQIKKVVSEKQKEVNKVLEAQKPLDDLTQKMLSDNAKALGLEETVEVIKDATAETNKFADSMQKVADIIANAKKLEKVDSPLTKRNFNSLKRAANNSDRPDQQTAQNIIDYTKLYMESGQSEILKVIRDYVDSSNLKDTLKEALHRTFTSAIEAAEKATVAETKEKTQTETVTMNKKQYADYMRKYAPWKNSDEFDYNLNRSIEELQKRGLASRKTTKSGKAGAWEIQVEVPINQLEKIEQKEKEVVEQSEKTSKAVSEVGEKAPSGLQKYIDKYEELKKKQQEYLSKLSEMATLGNGKIENPEEYAKLKYESDLTSRQMQEEVEKAYRNFGVNLSNLANIHTEVAQAAEKQAEEEKKVVDSSISNRLQKKIDKYKELYEKQQKLLSILSDMASSGVGKIENAEEYSNLKKTVDSITNQMNKLTEKAYKNNKANLRELALGHLEVAEAAKEQISAEKNATDSSVNGSSVSAAEGVKEATEAIKKEGDAAQKGTKKKEKLAKAEKELAEGSKEAASETDKAAEAIEKEYKNADKNREKVLREEQKIRKAIAEAPRKEAENMLSSMDSTKWQKNFTTEFSFEIDNLRDQIENLLKADNVDTSVLDVIRSKFNLLDETVSNTRLAAKQTIAEETSITGMQSKIAGFLDQNTAMSRDFQKQLKALLNTLESGGEITIDELKQIGSEFNRISAQVKELHQTGQSFGSSFLKQLKSANAQLIATYFSFQDFIRYAREGFQTIVEVDTALTELRKVSDASDDRLAQSFKKSTETAKELGATISDVIGVTADWARLGYNVDEAEELARVTTLFQTVGDNMTAEDTSSYLISTLQGFQMATSQAEEIADKYNEVDICLQS